MHFPSMNTRGTVRAPVVCEKYSCAALASLEDHLSNSSRWNLTPAEERADLVALQWGQYVLENTATLLPLIMVEILSAMADMIN